MTVACLASLVEFHLGWHGYLLTAALALISLGAIDFGVIVDAAVIVMENIMRHLEEGADKLEDAIEIGRASCRERV